MKIYDSKVTGLRQADPKDIYGMNVDSCSDCAWSSWQSLTDNGWCAKYPSQRANIDPGKICDLFEKKITDNP